MVTIPSGKTFLWDLVKDGLVNTAPRMVVEGFRTQYLTMSALIIISQQLCSRKSEELPLAGDIILVQVITCVIHIADLQSSKPRLTDSMPVLISDSNQVSVSFPFQG